MTKRTNKKTTVAKRFRAILLVALMLVTVVPNTTMVYAAANAVVAEDNGKLQTLGNITIQVSNGAVKETVGGVEVDVNGTSVASAAAVDENGATYILWLSGNLYLYSYKYQGKNGDSVKIASGVSELKADGYYSGNIRHNYLTDSEVKEKLGITNNGNNAGNNNNNNGNTNNTSSQKGVYLVGSNTVLYGDGTNTYVLSNGKNVGEVAESNGTVYIRYTDGTIQTWKTASKGSTVVLTTIATSTKALTKDSNGNVTGYITNDGKVTSFTYNNTTTNSSQYLAIQNGQATLLIWENNNISKTYSLANKDVVWGYQDSNKTCYLKKQDGSLWIWNYDLQKSDSTINLLKVDSKVKDAIVSNNLIIGYTVDGSSTMRNTWSLDQVKVAIALNSANSTTTKNNTNNNNTSTNTSKEYIVVHDSGSELYYLEDSKSHEIVDEFRFKNNIVYYHGKKYKATEVWFNGKKGRIIIRNKKVTQVVIKVGKKQKVKDVSRITKSIVIAKGAAKTLIKTNGNTIKLTKY